MNFKIPSTLNVFINILFIILNFLIVIFVIKYYISFKYLNFLDPLFIYIYNIFNGLFNFKSLENINLLFIFIFFSFLINIYWFDYKFLVKKVKIIYNNYIYYFFKVYVVWFLIIFFNILGIFLFFIKS